MKAIRFHETGGPEVLRVEDVALAAPGAGEIRIRQTAIAVNFRDILARRGRHAVKSLPSGLGIESAGVVEVVGSDVTDITVGDRVACVCGPDGAYAEARNVPSARAVKLPDGIDDQTAAAMMVRGMTARYLLHATYKVQRGDTIVIHAAAGGVGLIVSQWARHLGATVIGTVGSPDKVATARAHGCDHIFFYDDFVAGVRAVTKGEGVPVVYDSVGRTTFERSLNVLRPRGILASFGEASGDPEPVAPRRLGQLGSIFLTHPSLPDYTATRDDLVTTANDLFDVVLSGKVSIVTNHRYPLADAGLAHRDIEQRRTTGSVLLIP